MRGMTKSAARVAHEALAVGRRTFPTYGSRTSRHDFTRRSFSRSWCCDNSCEPTTVAS
jgi:hypothetical protein